MQDWNTKKTGERELDLKRLAMLLLRRMWLLVLAALIGALIAFMYSAVFVEPVYTSGFTAYVNNHMNLEGKVNTSSGDLAASLNLVPVYEDIIVSRSVLRQAADVCNVPVTMVANGVSTSSSDDAAVLTVFVRTHDPELSLRLAEEIAKAAPVKVAEVVEGSSMRIIDEPMKPTGRSSPNHKRNAAIGFAIGFFLMAAIVVGIDLGFDYVQSGEDLEKRYNVVVIGHIPDIFEAEKENAKYRKAGNSQK